MVRMFPNIIFRYTLRWDATFGGIWSNSFITPGMYVSGVTYIYCNFGIRLDPLVRDSKFFMREVEL
jgi:hypothetical protein